MPRAKTSNNKKVKVVKGVKLKTTRSKKPTGWKGWLARTDNKKIAIFAALVAIIGVVTVLGSRAASTLPPVLNSASAPPQYALKWSDEFEGSTIDTSKWNIQNLSNYGSGNQEDMCYMRNNVGVAGGKLQLVAKRETVQCDGTNPDTGNKTYYFTSGMVTTQAKQGTTRYEFKKGYVEASIKMPAGNPFWLGFWLVGGSGAPGWPAYGEIDIAELVTARPDLTNGTYHYTRADNGAHAHTSFSNRYNVALGSNNTCYMCSANAGAQNTLTGAISTAFHRYGVLWEADRLTWYLDGKPFRSLEANGDIYEYYGPDASTKKKADKVAPSFSAAGFGYNHTIHLTNTVGGAFTKSFGYTGGETSSGYNNGNLNATFPATTEIDYVRVYQYDANTPSTPPPTPINASPAVSLTAPSNGATATAPASFALNAAASDRDGTIAKVEFYRGSTKIGEDTSSPYQFTAANLAAGSYTFSAKAFDNVGASTTSSVANVTVNAPTPPPPTPTAPAVPGNPRLTTSNGGSITFSWNASAAGAVYSPRFAPASGNLADENEATGPWKYASNLSGTSWTITTQKDGSPLQDGQEYVFQVRAKSSTAANALRSDYTAQVKVTYRASDVTPPSAVSGLKRALAFDWTRFAYNLDLTWTAATDNKGVASYEVYKDDGSGERLLGTSTTTKFTEKDTYWPDKNNVYRVRAKDTSGNTGGFSSPVNAKSSCLWIFCSLP